MLFRSVSQSRYGGGQIYKEALPYVERIFQTKVLEYFKDSDTFFPKLNEERWQLISSIRHEEENSYSLDFDILYRLLDSEFKPFPMRNK